MKAAELAERLGAKRSGQGWVARCPAHEDRTPSLSITEGNDGRLLLHCHAGCTFEAVAAALNLPRSTTRSTNTVAATYDYADERGALLFQVVRFLPKGFRQCRPDGAGGWLWKLDGVRRVPYRLPQLLNAVAAHKRVFVVEGEKDVHAVERQGYTATCNPGGAGKWRPEFSALFSGADVVVVADRDPPGLAHARQVCDALRSVAAKVVLVEPAVGKDVSDHLDAGRTLAELVPVSAPAASGLTPISVLLAEPDEPVSWIVEGLLPANGLGVIAGKPKAGKSTTARAMALRVARGEPVLGRSTVRGPVIYLGLEDPRRVTRDHLRRLGARATDDLHVWTGPRPQDALNWLKCVLDHVDPVLVVADTLQHLLGVSDLNDYSRVMEALGPVLALVRPRRAHLLLTHHAGKGGRSGFDAVLGSTAILGSVDVALLMRRREDSTRTLASLQRVGEDLPESVISLDASGEPHFEGTRAEYDAHQMDEQVLAFLNQQDEPVGREAVKAGVEGRAEHVVAALQRLAASGVVARTGAGKRGDPFLFRRSGYVGGTEEQNPSVGNSPDDSETISVPDAAHEGGA